MATLSLRDRVRLLNAARSVDAGSLQIARVFLSAISACLRKGVEEGGYSQLIEIATEVSKLAHVLAESPILHPSTVEHTVPEDNL